MIVAAVRFGQIHAVTHLGDKIRGKQVIHLACMGDYLVTPENADRITLREADPDSVMCENCLQELEKTNGTDDTADAEGQASPFGTE